MTDTMVYEAGKGDRYRKVDSQKFANNYDLIFKKKNDTVQDNPSSERTLAQDATQSGTETEASKS